MATKKQPARRPQRLRRLLLVALLALALLAIGRALLPHWLLHQINDRLGKLETYHGHVQELDLFLLGGTYVMRGVTFEKANGQVKVPLVSIDWVRLSVSWNALLEGRLEGEAHVQRPVLNLVDAPDAEREQFGTEQNWQRTVREAYPLDINHVRIADGEAHFRNFHSTPRIDVALHSIHADAANLRNRATSEAGRQAEIRVDALTYNRTPVTLRGTYQWLERDPTFSFDFEMRGLPVEPLKAMAQVYTNADPASGTLTLTAKVEARDGRLGGYVKPLFENLKVLSWEQDVEKQEKNPFQLAWEGLTDFVSELLENERTHTVGSRVPISGEIGKARPEILPSVMSSLRNAFIEALNSDIERPVHLPRIEENENDSTQEK